MVQTCRYYLVQSFCTDIEDESLCFVGNASLNPINLF